MRHLLAIGRRPPGAAMHDFLMNDVDERVSGLGSLVVARCDSPADLVTFVAQHGRGKGRVDRLDVFDHGAPGMQYLGSGVLFQSDGDICSPLVNAALAAALVPHLSDVAQVRLLGCLTATAINDAGRWLLYKLAAVLGGHRVVFGTIDRIDVGDFGPGGFLPVQEEPLLFSSLAAIDGVAPDSDGRRKHRAAFSTVLCGL